MENSNQQNQTPIIINAQYIKDLSFEIPHAPQILQKLNTAPQIKVNVNVKHENIEDNTYNVSLSFNIDADIEQEKLFILELEYAAAVTLNIPQEHIEPLLQIEIPQLLFPFVRNIIAQALSNGGLPPILINPIDFMTLYRRKKAN